MTRTSHKTYKGNSNLQIHTALRMVIMEHSKVVFVNKSEIHQMNFTKNLSEVHQKITSVPHFSLVWEILLALCWQTAFSTQQIRINYFDIQVRRIWYSAERMYLSGLPNAEIISYSTTVRPWYFTANFFVSMSSKEICISREGSLLYRNRK